MMQQIADWLKKLDIAPFCTTSVLHPNKSSRIASWRPWMTSTSIQSSILGPISLIKLHDYDSNHENAELDSSQSQRATSSYPTKTGTSFTAGRGCLIVGSAANTALS